MKTHRGSLVAAVIVSVLTAVSVASAKMGGVSPGTSPRPNDGGFGAWRRFDGHRSFDRDRFHNHFSFFFFGAGPIWYPYYYYYGPPYYAYDYGYDYAPQYVYDNPPAYDYGDRAPVYQEYDGRDYLMLGHDAGKALRLKTVSRDWLVEYLRAYILDAPTSARDDFRRGFLSGYGEGAESILKKATQAAQQPNPPGTVPLTSGSSSPSQQK